MPCCVFPALFPRRVVAGVPVRSHAQFLDYLQAKDARIERDVLYSLMPPNNVVLFVAPEGAPRSPSPEPD